MPSSLPAKAVLFDLLTALLNSWAIWNEAAGSEEVGRRWRHEYLNLTYGCGAYQPYEELVAQAAMRTGLGLLAVDRLKSLWNGIPAWNEVPSVLANLQGKVQLGVVTNCSAELGRMAAARLPINWDVVVTAEEAGYYKPDVHPYRLALHKLGISASECRFVAGSAYDLFGTRAVGLRTYWHNRMGLKMPEGAPAPEIESNSLLALTDWVLGTT